jgi:hypothetical protein
VADLLSDEHLAARKFFVDIDHPAVGPLHYPGVPYTFSNTPLPLKARPAPLLGQHNDRFLGGEVPSPPATSQAVGPLQAGARPLTGGTWRRSNAWSATVSRPSFWRRAGSQAALAVTSHPRTISMIGISRIPMGLVSPTLWVKTGSKPSRCASCASWRV